MIQLFKKCIYFLALLGFSCDTQAPEPLRLTPMHGGILVLDQESNCVPCTGRWILNHWTTGKTLIQLLDFMDFCQVTRVVWPTQIGACSNLGVCQNHLEDLIYTELRPSFKMSDSEI